LVTGKQRSTLVSSKHYFNDRRDKAYIFLFIEEDIAATRPIFRVAIGLYRRSNSDLQMRIEDAVKSVPSILWPFHFVPAVDDRTPSLLYAV
jgi:hypothetical protein